MALKLLCPHTGGVLQLFSPASPVARSHQWDRKAGPTFCDSPWGHGVRCGEPLIGARCKACGVVNRFGGPDLPSSCSGVERLTEAKMARSCGADVDGRWPNGFPYRSR